jgi:hypothetical protein
MQTDETTMAETETIAPPLDVVEVLDETNATPDETAGDDTGEALPPITEESAAVGAYAAGGGTGLAIEMTRQSFAEDLARAEEGTLSYGFDLERAWREIEGIAERVDVKKRAWDSAKAEAAEAKKDYDLEVETLRKRIDALSAERRKPAWPLQGAEDLSATPKGCQWERTNGRLCPVCRPMLADPSRVPALDNPQHPAHADHVAAVAEVEARAFGERLEEAEVFLDVSEVAGLDLSAKATLEQWLNERAVIAAAQAEDAEVQHLPFPEVFARKAHIAGEPDTAAGNGQACTRCGRQLLDDVDIVDDGTYPVGAHVGLDCEGAHEIARPPKKRGRAKKNRPAPEAERAEQIAAAADQVDDGELAH